MVMISDFSTASGSRAEGRSLYSTEAPAYLTGDLMSPCDGCFACNHREEVAGSSDPVTGAGVGHRCARRAVDGLGAPPPLTARNCNWFVTQKVRHGETSGKGARHNRDGAWRQRGVGVIEKTEPVVPSRGTPERHPTPVRRAGVRTVRREAVRPASWTRGTGCAPSAARSHRFPDLSQVFLEMPCAVRHGESEATGGADQCVFQAGV
jgi:hypothetical protein